MPNQIAPAAGATKQPLLWGPHNFFVQGIQITIEARHRMCMAALGSTAQGVRCMAAHAQPWAVLLTACFAGSGALPHDC